MYVYIRNLVMFMDCKTAINKLKVPKPTSSDLNHLFVDILRLHKNLMEVDKVIEVAWIR